MAPPLELYLLTFNCAQSLVDSHSFARNLFAALPEGARLPDIVVLSLQEIAPLAYSLLGEAYFKPYLDRVTASVQLAAEHHDGANEAYREVAHVFLGMTGIVLFARQNMASRVDVKGGASTGVGLWGMGNKGAAAVRVGYSWEDGGISKETELTFVAAHLAPMESGLKRRNLDWEHIVRNLAFVPATANGQMPYKDQGADGTDDHEEDTRPLLPDTDGPHFRGLYDTRGPIFVAGDLNYRTGDAPPSPTAYLSYPQPSDPPSSPRSYRALLENDQLTRELHARRTLHDFAEAAITFPPTYKYSTKALPAPPPTYTDADAPAPAPSAPPEPPRWAWAKHRYPSWCDRILFHARSARALAVHAYAALPLQPPSDHRPVALAAAVAPPGDAAPAAEPCAPPFPLDPRWATRRAAARRRELAVGVLAWLALTREGNAVLAAALGALVAAWLVFGLAVR